MEAYWLSIVGVLALCLLSVLLAVYSGASKGRAGGLSGPVIPWPVTIILNGLGSLCVTCHARLEICGSTNSTYSAIAMPS